MRTKQNTLPAIIIKKFFFLLCKQKSYVIFTNKNMKRTLKTSSMIQKRIGMLFYFVPLSCLCDPLTVLIIFLLSVFLLFYDTFHVLFASLSSVIDKECIYKTITEKTCIRINMNLIVQNVFKFLNLNSTQS